MKNICDCKDCREMWEKKGQEDRVAALEKENKELRELALMGLKGIVIGLEEVANLEQKLKEKDYAVNLKPMIDKRVEEETRALNNQLQLLEGELNHTEEMRRYWERKFHERVTTARFTDKTVVKEVRKFFEEETKKGGRIDYRA